jgi:hypothetical protein
MATSSRSAVTGLVGIGSIVGGWLSLTTLVWTRMPANPAAHLPVMRLTFAELRAGADRGSPPLTTAFFDWAAVAGLAALTVLCVLALMRPASVIRSAGALVAVASFGLAVAALKAPVTWHVFWKEMGWSQIGSYLYFLALTGFLVTFLAARTGLAVLMRARAVPTRAAPRRPLSSI